MITTESQFFSNSSQQSDSRASSILGTPPPEFDFLPEEDEEAAETGRGMPKNVAQFFDLTAIEDSAGDGQEEPETAADRGTMIARTVDSF